MCPVGAVETFAAYIDEVPGGAASEDDVRKTTTCDAVEVPGVAASEDDFRTPATCDVHVGVAGSVIRVCIIGVATLGASFAGDACRTELRGWS